MASTKSRRRARDRGAITKAIDPGLMRGFAEAPKGIEPVRYGLMDALNIVNARAMGADPAAVMPRDPRDLATFGPGNPLPPEFIDRPNKDGTADPRIYEYQQSWNLPGNQRKEVPWQVLRQAADGVDLVRLCIEARKAHIGTLQWSWAPKEQVIEDAYAASPKDGYEDAAQKIREQFQPEIKRLTEFWERPWRTRGLSFRAWVRMVVEEYLVVDGMVVYPRKSYGGDVLDLELVDASTIKPLLDHRGSRPLPPYPAFQQELYGFPRGEWRASGEYDENGKLPNAYEAGELYYGVGNPRLFSPYGFSPVEQVLFSARLWLKRQGWLLAEYDDGSTPLTMIEPPGDPALVGTFTPAQRREWEDALNGEYGGQTRARHRAKVLPPGWTPHQLSSVDERYKPEFDLFIVKLVAGFMGMRADQLGFSESQGLGSAGWAESQAEAQGRVGLKPDTEVLSEVINCVSRDFLGAPPELEFTFNDPTSENDKESDDVRDQQRKRATITLNDDRRALKLPLLSLPEADMPHFVTATGPVFMEGAYERVQQAAEAQMMQAETAKEGTKGKLELEQAKLDDGAKAREEDREFQRETRDSEQEFAREQADTTTKAVTSELAAFATWRKRNPEPKRPFVFKAATPDDFDEPPGPDIADFGDEWLWVTDEMIEKRAKSGLDWRAWNAMHPNKPKGPNGRWVKVGTLFDTPGEGKSLVDVLTEESKLQAHPFGAHPKPHSDMRPTDREGERVVVRARGDEERGAIVGQVGGIKGAGNDFLVVRHDDGTFQTYDSRVVRADEPEAPAPTEAPKPKRLPDDTHDALMKLGETAAEYQRQNKIYPLLTNKLDIPRGVVTRLERGGYVKREHNMLGPSVKFTDKGHDYLMQHRGTAERDAELAAQQKDLMDQAAKANEDAAKARREGGMYSGEIARLAGIEARAAEARAESVRQERVKLRGGAPTPKADTLTREQAAPKADDRSPAEPEAPKVKIPSREGKARRGDVMVVEEKTRDYVIGEGSKERTEYKVYEVTSVSREGEPLKVRDLQWLTSERSLKIGNRMDRAFSGRRQIIPGDQLDVAGLSEALNARTYPNSTTPMAHDSLAELRDAIRPHLAESGATPRPAPPDPDKEWAAVLKRIQGAGDFDAQLRQVNAELSKPLTAETRQKLEDIKARNAERFAAIEEAARDREAQEKREQLRAEATAAPKADDRSPAERHVRQAYAKLRAQKDRPDLFEWVSLTPLREELAARGMSRGEQDRALWDLTRMEGVNIVPENNQKTLTAADRDASIRIGNQDKHLISLFSEDWRAALNDSPPLLPRQARQAAHEAKRAGLNAMTLPQLRALARRVGLSPSGRKADLVANLAAYEGSQDLFKAAQPEGGDTPKADAPADERWPGWAQDLAIAAGAASALGAALAAGAASLRSVQALAGLFAEWAQGWRPSDPRPDVLTWLQASTDLGPRIEADIRQPIEDAWLEGYFVGSRSAAALVENLAAGIPPREAGTVEVDWGNWTPGDLTAARRIMTADGSIRPWLDLLRDAGITIKRIADNRLEEVARCLHDGLQRGLSPDQIAKDLQRTINDPAWCKLVAVTETNRAMSAATLDTYEVAGIDSSEWMTALDQRVCKRCKANEDAGPVRLGQRYPSGDYHPPGHPRCRCALVPTLGSLDLIKRAKSGLDWKAWNAKHPKRLKDSRGRWARGNGASLADDNPLEALDWLDFGDDDGPTLEAEPQPAARPRLGGPNDAAWEARLASGVVSRRVLSTDANTSHVELLTFGDGSKAVYKTNRGHGSDLTEDLDAEQLAVPIAQMLGLNPPDMYRSSDGGAYFTYVDGARLAMELVPEDAYDLSGLNAHMEGPDGWRMGLLDLLMDNGDRNIGNWFIRPDGTLVPIDHGQGWSFTRSPWRMGKANGAEAPVMHEFYRPFLRWGDWQDSDLSPGWLESLRPRLEALRPQFARLGHEDWLEFTLERLDVLKAHGKGTVTL